MSSKTPVSILQEMMSRLGTLPKYDLIYDGTGTHEALFKYKVYANGISAIGSGRSKKQAKQEAAESALERLAEHQITDSAPASTDPLEVLSPYKDNLNENAVGALQDFCANNEIPMPKYELMRVEGQPHARTFTFVCCISKQRELGLGRTKKQAKQQAANGMLSRLKQMMDQDNAVNGTLNGQSEAVNSYLGFLGSPRKKVKLNEYPALYHKYLKHSDGDTIALIQQLNLPDFPMTPEQQKETKEDLLSQDWLATLHQLLDKLNLSMSFVVWNSPKKEGNGGATGDAQQDAARDDESSCLVMLLLSTVPEAVLRGCGSTVEEAHQMSALNALQYLKIMTK